MGPGWWWGQASAALRLRVTEQGLPSPDPGGLHDLGVPFLADAFLRQWGVPGG